MTKDIRIRQLLDQLLSGHATPEEVCATCPELLPAVRRLWEQMSHLGTDFRRSLPASRRAWLLLAPANQRWPVPTRNSACTTTTGWKRMSYTARRKR
jgi:hypothetical protein